MSGCHSRATQAVLTGVPQAQLCSLLTHFPHAFAVREVICDDLAQLREVPTVPFPTAHDVVVQFFVQVIKKC